MLRKKRKDKPSTQKKPKQKIINNADCLSTYIDVTDFLGNGIIEVSCRGKKTKCIILRILGILRKKSAGKHIQPVFKLK